MQLKNYIFIILSPLFWLKYNRILKTFPKVISSEDSLRHLIATKKSLARFGDGEFNIILGDEIGFQNKNIDLASRLKIILSSPSASCIIGIPNVFNGLTQFRRGGRNFWLYKIVKEWAKWNKLFIKDYEYADALISRFFLDIKDKEQSEKILNLWQTLWKNREVVIIEGEGTKMGVGNDLFKDCLKINRIICPSSNAFDKYSEILQEALKIDKGRLILIALGPTASVLAYDLGIKGYQAIDTGHLDLEYNWMLQGAVRKEKVKGRIINELHNREYEEIYDLNYEKQIIAHIK